jgi:hypothetical protein
MIILRAVYKLRLTRSTRLQVFSALLGDDDPQTVNDTRENDKNPQNQVNPEVLGDADLEENSEGRHEDTEDNQ